MMTKTTLSHMSVLNFEKSSVNDKSEIAILSIIKSYKVSDRALFSTKLSVVMSLMFLFSVSMTSGCCNKNSKHLNELYLFAAYRNSLLPYDGVLAAPV